jgi:flavin reductase (DIM6/NTAB) family NADH-FMN oxidoreductase RutF
MRRAPWHAGSDQKRCQRWEGHFADIVAEVIDAKRHAGAGAALHCRLGRQSIERATAIAFTIERFEVDQSEPGLVGFRRARAAKSLPD